MKRIFPLVLMLLLALPLVALAHFMVIQPSAPIVLEKSKSTVTLDLRFAHPFEQGYMDKAPPVRFGVTVEGKTTDLKASLHEKKVGENRTWTADYRLKQPGDHIFFVEPAPYWEPAESKFIVHYTKVVVHAFGLEEGWDELVGLPTEIKPLTRPYGLWTGNVFQGMVLLHGKPVPFAEVEVGYDNKNLEVKAPAELYHIQTIKADANGIFTYAMPRHGWWVYAALNEDDKKLTGPDGQAYPVEIGALIWVLATDME